MKSLWKISRRYIWSAILVTVIILYANMAVFLYFGTTNIRDINKNEIDRERMEGIVQQIVVEDDVYDLSSEGYELLAGSSFIWAMLLDEGGDVCWSWQLPGEFPRHYSTGEVAAFSRWYLRDYPVRVWRHGNQLMVYGMEKDSVTKIQAVYDQEMILGLPDMIKGFLIVNLFLLIGLALFFGYRFYRSIQPIAGGIEGLSEKRGLTLSEKGITGELAAKLNQVSAILKAQDEKLRQRDRARTDWIAGVSHDIRTPLALIGGYADELAEEPALGEEGRKRAEQIRSLSLTIGQLISDLNLTSKLEYQAQPLQCMEFFPAQLLRECVAEYYNQGLSVDYEIEVLIAPDAEKVKLFGDTGLLLRAFRNLLGNSIRHNPGGCMVTVRLEQDAESVWYSFSDTGPGIPEKVVCALRSKECKKVEKTDTIDRTDSTENSENPVHVMGLRVVMQIVKAHGWQMEFVKRESGTYDVQISVIVTKHR